MITKMKTIAATTALAAMMTLGAQAANATPIEPSQCDILNFTTSTECISPVSGGDGGNVKVEQMNGQSIFGYDDWTEIAKSDVGDPNDIFSLTISNDGKSGTWTLIAPYTWGEGVYAFAIKGAVDNAVYLMDKAYTFGTWNTIDLENKGGNDPALSNITLFGTTDVSVVPLPAAGWLLLMGIGGLGVASRRRRKAQHS